jgi:hypothetical protein
MPVLEDGALRVADAGFDGRAVADVVGVGDDVCADVPGRGGGFVIGAVIDDEDLVRLAGGLHDPANLLDNAADHLLFTIRRNDYADFYHIL